METIFCGTKRVEHEYRQTTRRNNRNTGNSSDRRETEVVETMGRVKLEKATGRNNITSEMIKYMGEEKRKQLTELMKEIMKSGKVKIKKFNSGILPLF